MQIPEPLKAREMDTVEKMKVGDINIFRRLIKKDKYVVKTGKKGFVILDNWDSAAILSHLVRNKKEIN